MSKDISTQFTKERNKECGRRGYGFWKKEKDDSISPRDYGEFLDKHKRRKR